MTFLCEVFCEVHVEVFPGCAERLDKLFMLFGSVAWSFDSRDDQFSLVFEAICLAINTLRIIRGCFTFRFALGGFKETGTNKTQVHILDIGQRQNL